VQAQQMQIDNNSTKKENKQLARAMQTTTQMITSDSLITADFIHFNFKHLSNKSNKNARTCIKQYILLHFC
jgi:hypothetical protein